jgi:cell division septum initiation protein DivIVA
MPPKSQKKTSGLNSSLPPASSPQSPQATSHIAELLRSFKEEISRELGDIKQSSKAVEKSLDFLYEAIDDLKKSIVGLKTDNAELRQECAALKKENAGLRSEVAVLDLEVKDMQQYSRNRNVEIKGVPMTQGENVDAILEATAKAIGVDYDKRRDISAAHRLQSNKRGGHPAIVVQFISRCTRADWLAAAKRRRLDTKNLHPTLQSGPVFVNEHLTQHSKDLLWRAKNLVRENRIAFAWCREGKIYIKLTAESKTIRLRCVDDLNRLTTS